MRRICVVSIPARMINHYGHRLLRNVPANNCRFEVVYTRLCNEMVALQSDHCSEVLLYSVDHF